MGVSCGNFNELEIAERAGIRGNNIFFNCYTPSFSDFQKAIKLGAIISIDTINQFKLLQQCNSSLSSVCFRYNPGIDEVDGISPANPLEDKFGLSNSQIIEAYKMAKDMGIKKFGIYSMVNKNELDIENIINSAVILFRLMVQLKRQLDIDFDFVNIGGGWGIPYDPTQEKINLKIINNLLEREYKKELSEFNIKPKLYMECSRYIIGEHGYLITKVEEIREIFKTYVQVNTNVCHLTTSLFNEYFNHYITILGKENYKK